MKRTSKTTESNKGGTQLAGKFFLSFQCENVKWRGVVLSQPAEGYFLVQLFDANHGEVSPRLRLVSVTEMVKWLFFESSVEMVEESQLIARQLDVKEFTQCMDSAEASATN